MHFTPFFLDFTIYVMAAPMHTTTIKPAIKFAILPPLLEFVLLFNDNYILFTLRLHYS